MAAHEISPRDVVSERTPRPLAGTLLAFDLAHEVELLEQEQPWQANGHNARTLIKNEDMRLVLIVLKRGARIREHQTYRQIVLQAVRGRVRIHIPDLAPEIAAGQLLALDRMVPHDVEALEDSTLLLTVGWSDE